MAYRLIEVDKLIIEPRKKNYLNLVMSEIGVILYCWFMYSINFPVKGVIIIYFVVELYLTLMLRRHLCSKYILDSRGITRILWKYEQTIFWGQFKTKRIEKSRGGSNWGEVAIFSTMYVQKPEWSNNHVFDYFIESHSWNFIQIPLKKNNDPDMLLAVDYDLFVKKMKEWNVDVPYDPWPYEEERED